ncbi:MAG: hypothetical protein J6K04_12695 [Lachnospiraceae bacterium]|nr:hypothetical protein [Lachnospiraceae bacterium]
MMKKKLFALLLTATMLCGLAACGAPEDVNAGVDTPAPTSETVPTAAPTETPAPAAKTISPLPVTIDMNNLTDCTVAVSFDKGDAYVDDNGVMQLKVKVYTYDLYDMVDIAMLTPGDTIILRGEDVLVTDLVRTDFGAVQINGGLDAGGYELITTENTVYFETGYSDAKTWFELGEATLPVSGDFILTDKMDLDKGEVTYYAGDFLTDDAGIFYHFIPNNTTIIIQNGQIIEIERIYTP